MKSGLLRDEGENHTKGKIGGKCRKDGSRVELGY